MTNFVSNEQIELQKNIAGEVAELLLHRHGTSPKAFVHTYGCQGNVADSERITLTKFKAINHYIEVLAQLENHKGVLYLDNGNHFKIME